MADIFATLFRNRGLTGVACAVAVMSAVHCSQDFLNNVCTNIIHMHKKQLNYYSGNYDQYVQTRAELEENQMKRYKWEQEQISHMKVTSHIWLAALTPACPTLLRQVVSIHVSLSIVCCWTRSAASSWLWRAQAEVGKLQNST
jgi:hypothetical protein